MGRDMTGAEAPMSRVVIAQSLHLPRSSPPVPGVCHEGSKTIMDIEEGRVRVDAMVPITHSKEEASRLLFLQN